jgi:hypothetical protein
LPAVVPVIVMEQLPFVRVQVIELNVTEPVPDWDQVTVPVGENPFTVALHLITFEEPATIEDGLHETLVVEVS